MEIYDDSLRTVAEPSDGPPLPPKSQEVKKRMIK